MPSLVQAVAPSLQDGQRRLEPLFHRLFTKNGRCQRNNLEQFNDSFHSGMHFEQISKNRELTACACSHPQASIADAKEVIVLANAFFPFLQRPCPEGSTAFVHLE